MQKFCFCFFCIFLVAVAQYSDDYDNCLNDEDIEFLCNTKMTNPDCQLPAEACHKDRSTGKVSAAEICNSLGSRLICTTGSYSYSSDAGFVLDWSNCGIKEIDYEFEDNTYYHYYRIKSIDLSFNNLTSVPKDFFRSSLVDISHNSLESLPKWNSFWSDTVYYYASVIDLSYNNLRDLPSGWDAFNSLVSLILRNNSLKSVPSDLGESGVEYLDLSYNNFRSMAGMPSSVKTLDLSNNRIRRVGDLSDLMNLDYLELSSNVIINYSYGHCNDKTNPLSVNLNYNCLNCDDEENYGCLCLQDTQGGGRCQELANLEALSGIALGMGWTFQCILILSIFVSFGLMVAL